MALVLVAPLALAGAGCQKTVSLESRIPALPEAAQHPVVYVTNKVVALPSAEVDAGRIEPDPLTGSKQPSFGMAVYLQNCQSCHGAVDPKTGKPGRPAAGVPDLSDPIYTWTRTPQEFYKDMFTPVSGDINHWGHANMLQKVAQSAASAEARATTPEQKLWNAVYYVWTFHTNINDIVQGGLTFGRYCSVCHGTKGRGDGNLAGALNPKPRAFIDFGWMVDKTDQRLYISISDGRPPSAMPAWKAALSPTQRIQIINYLRQFTYKYPEDIAKRMAEAPPAT